MVSKLKIAGICPLYNVLSAQYPFVEAIITTLPLVDVLFVNDGGSTDGTLEVLERMAKRWPKIVVTQIRQEKSQFWESIDHVLVSLIYNKCQGYDWIIEIQADEFFHPQLYDATLLEIEKAHCFGFNALRQPIKTITRWEDEDAYVYRNIRIFRNLPNIKSRWGGDCFYFEGLPENRNGFTSHNLPPEYDSNIIRHHLKDLFFMDQMLQAKNHAEFFATEHLTRKEVYKELYKRWEMLTARQGMSRTRESVDIHPEIPELYYGLVGLTEYMVRDELFD